jgi:VanZ family protein
MAVIFALSSRTGGQLDRWLPLFRDFVPGLRSFDPMHYAAYFILALTVAYGLGRLAFTWRGVSWIIVICVLYGASDEWHQAYVPNRTPDLNDLWHDTIGAAAACLILLLIRYLGGNRSSRNYSYHEGRNRPGSLE